LYTVDVNDFKDITIQDRPGVDIFPEFVGKEVSSNRQISLEINGTEAITFSLSIGRNDRSYYNFL